MDENTKINLSAIMKDKNGFHKAKDNSNNEESLLDSISNTIELEKESSKDLNISEKIVIDKESKKVKKLGKKTWENSIHLDSFLIHWKNINISEDENFENTLTLSSQDISKPIEVKKDETINEEIKPKPKNYLLSLGITKDEVQKDETKIDEIKKTEESKNEIEEQKKDEIIDEIIIDDWEEKPKPKISLDSLKIVELKKDEEKPIEMKTEEINLENKNEEIKLENTVEEVKPEIEEIKKEEENKFLEEVKKDDEIKIITDKITEVDHENDENFEEEETPKKTFINLNTIKTFEHKEEKIEPIKIEEVKKEEEKNELFSNYVSSFKEKEDSLLAKIKKLKNLPKTRPVFLSVIILITISWIWMLFVIDPDTHSFEHYKVSILNILKKEKTVINEKIDEIKKDDTKIKPPIPKKEVKEEIKEKVKIWWLDFDFWIQTNTTWEQIYNYKWQTYNSKEELEKNITVEVIKIKKDKVRNILLENYKKIDTNTWKILNNPIENPENIPSENNINTQSWNIIPENIPPENIINDPLLDEMFQ